MTMLSTQNNWVRFIIDAWWSARKWRELRESLYQSTLDSSLSYSFGGEWIYRGYRYWTPQFSSINPAIS